MNYSQNLIDAVMDNINPDEQKGLSEYELWNHPPANQSAGSGKTVTSVDREGSHHLMFGKYVYRTMESGELEALTSHSTYLDGKYTINDFQSLTIGKHVGNLTQAVTYGGILVRFEMKPNFNRVILNQIGRNEGTRDSDSIGMKYENEGMLKNNAHQSSFSFYIPSEVARVFLSNVACFEVFKLGKTSGSRHG